LQSAVVAGRRREKPGSPVREYAARGGLAGDPGRDAGPAVFAGAEPARGRDEGGTGNLGIGDGESWSMRHLLSIEKLTGAEMEKILAEKVRLKKERGRHSSRPLTGQIWAMLFSKSSTRTRVSFDVGIRELGGQVIFLPTTEIQLGRGEPIKDTARVLGRI